MPLKPRTQRFEQIKTALINAILGGQFAPGDRLPSLRDLCEHFDMSLVTVQRAVQELKEEEWLVASARIGITVADPLPPVAHLMRLKKEHRPPSSPAHEVIGTGTNGTLTCLIHDEALLPLFEWAAREYAEAYAPCSLRLEVESLRGRDDAEAMRSLEADLVLLSSYAANRAVHAGAITPADGMLAADADRFAGTSPAVLKLLTWRGKLWAAPLMLGGPVLAADEGLCRRFGVDRARLTGVEAVLAALESAAANAGETDEALCNLTFILLLAVAAGHEFPGIRGAPEYLARPEVRALLARMRALAQRPAVALTRFDQWDRTDFSKVAVRYQPSVELCRDIKARADLGVLPAPNPREGRAPMTAYCLAVSTQSVHPFEAWEWAARLAEAPFQSRLAELAYDVPVSAHADVRAAFARAVGAENAETLLALAHRPSGLYGIGDEDVLRYLWEVLGNELHRFVSGLNDYDRLLERVRTKTARFVQRSERAPASTRDAAPAGVLA